MYTFKTFKSLKFNNCFLFRNSSNLNETNLMKHFLKCSPTSVSAYFRIWWQEQYIQTMILMLIKCNFWVNFFFDTIYILQNLLTIHHQFPATQEQKETVIIIKHFHNIMIDFFKNKYIYCLTFILARRSATTRSGMARRSYLPLYIY